MKLHMTRSNSKGKFNKLWLLAIALIIIVVIAIAFAAVGIANNTAIVQNETKHYPIRFDVAGVNNQTSSALNILWGLLTPTKGDMIVIETSASRCGSALGEGHVLSVTDNESVSYSFVTDVSIGGPGFGCQSFEEEFWAGKVQTVGTDNITVTWNNPQGKDLNNFIMSSYMNVNATGHTANATGTTQLSSSVAIPLTVNGARIVGGNSYSDNTTITPGPNQLQREFLNFAPQMDLEDSDNFGMRVATFTEGFTAVNKWISAAFELIPNIQPSNPCTTTNISTVNCKVLNSVILSQFGTSNTNEAMTSGQVYCTGIQSAALTLKTTNPNIVIGGMYLMTDVNVTGVYIVLTLQISSTPIASGFAAGNCGTSLVSISAGNSFFNILNTGLPTSGFVARNLAQPAGTTIYAGIAVTLRSPGVVPVLMKTGIGSSAGQAIFMQEQA